MHISDLSRVMHDAIFKDKSQSLCSRAYALQDRSTFWRVWVWVFTERHCRRSWEWYWRE